MIHVIITSFTDFGDFTTPLITSLRQFEKKPFRIMVIDNGAKDEYPAGDYDRIRFGERASWARMINKGASLAQGDWILFLNDDVVCVGPFVDFIEELDKGTVWGPKVGIKPPEWHGVGVEVRYLACWLLAIQGSVFEKIGGMDEWYPKVGMDDIDFCWRAGQMGLPVEAADFPFRHLQLARRNKWDGFKEQMDKSIQYFIDTKVRPKGVK